MAGSAHGRMNKDLKNNEQEQSVSARSPSDAGGKAADRPAGTTPEWSRGLRELYDSVVEEPLPDTFKDLLAKFDGDCE